MKKATFQKPDATYPHGSLREQPEMVLGYKKQETFFAIMQNGRLLLDEGRLPIFYTKRVAEEHALKFEGSKIIKIKIHHTKT